MQFFLLILLSGTIRGIGYIVSKYISLGKGSAHAMALANEIMDTLITLPIGIIYLAQNPVNLEFGVLLLAIVSAAMYGLCVALQYAALKRIDMSVMGIILRLNILFTSLIGVVVLHENMNAWNYLGLLAILSGNFAVVYKKGKFDFNQGVLFAILAAICSALASVMDKQVLNSINSVFYVFLNSLLIMLTLLLMKPKALKESVGLIRKRFFIFLLYSSIIVSAWFIGSYVLQNMDVSKFTPVQKSITLIIPVISGILIFKEKQNLREKIVGLGLAIIGIALMYI
jgi:drug/metabolite transporter (DMT)-like permease